MSIQNEPIRLLAAIMFADMVGYSKLMHEDEAKAKRMRDRQREVVDECILKHRGQVMQYYGDGTLSMFGSAIDGVKCATEIQLELQKDLAVPLRIGLHVGDVVYDDEGIYGDAVNIAARVQSLSAPAGVMLSGKVFDEVKNHPGIRIESYGFHELKNIVKPISLYAIASDGIQTPSHKDLDQITGSNKNSVAVLPFANFSADSNNEYFSDGITEEIINALVRVDGIKVTSRTSVFAYKNNDRDIRFIGEELNVSSILEGSVRLAGDRVRVTAQLINVSDGFHIWSKNFDGDLQDIFAVQDEISQGIASLLEDSFIIDKNRKLYEAGTDSVDAFNLYLQGLFFGNKRTPEGAVKAIEYYKKAIEASNTYAEAYAELANCYVYLAAIGHLSGREAYEKGSEYAQKAVELNQGQALSYTTLGFIELFDKWDFGSAETYFRKAITVEPENVDARLAYSFYNRIIGKLDKMVQQAEFAEKLDPLSLPVLLDVGTAYTVVGDYKAALEKFDKILELDPTFRAAQEAKAINYIFLGELDKAEKLATEYLSDVEGPLQGNMQLGYIQALKGNVEGARGHLELLKKKGLENPEFDLALDYAILHVALNEYDEAFEQLEEAYNHRLGSLLLIKTIGAFQLLKDDERYKRLIEKVGFPTIA